jgi:glycerol-3-phosphate cytidylyltransferase-like family protein
MIRGVIAGNFDVLHPGYIAMFDECKKHCDRLNNMSTRRSIH